ncbi:MAG: class I SAM-dependent methyltransferase [archaeon]
MVKINEVAEFDGIRAEMYEQAISKFPDARTMDIEAMSRLLDPRSGEKILGFGEGNGYFCTAIAQAVGEQGHYLVTDPSEDQLNNLKKNCQAHQVEVQANGVENLIVQNNYFDKAWSFGAYHHCPEQIEGMKRVYDSLKSGGTLVLCDVFQGSELARHFDETVARYCITGHEVKFLSNEFARTLCHLAGFADDKVELISLPQKWRFDSKKDLGEFIYKLHAMTLYDGHEEEKINRTIESCERLLGVSYKNGKYELNWPMQAIIATK